MADEHPEIKFESIMTTIGAVLIGCGLIWFVYRQWSYINDFLKILIFVIATIVAYYYGYTLKNKSYIKSSEALFFLGSILIIATTFLVANILKINLEKQNLAWILLISLIGNTIMTYLLESYSNLFTSLVVFLQWAFIQFITLANDANSGMIAILFLLCGILFYGLSLWHERLVTFSKFYQIWTIIYVLLCGHIFTYQIALQGLWKNNNVAMGGVIFLSIFAIAALSLTITGIYKKRLEAAIENKEVFGAIIIFGIMIFMILLSLTTETSSYQNKNLGTMFYIVWILINVLYISMIILLAEYGVWTKNNAIINNCFMAFIVTIIARYIGFIMDYGGYLGFAIVSIIGGIIIIVGGIYIEKWRKKVLSETTVTAKRVNKR